MERRGGFQLGDPLWSERASQESERGGQGPLGMQMDRIGLNSDLLPGITTITNRARYISFYVWAASRVTANNPPETKPEFKARMYEYDRLFALASVAHGEKKSSILNHKGIGGSNNCGDKYNCAHETIDLDFSHVDDSGGGYGSTYAGPLETMGLMVEDDGDQYRKPSKKAKELIEAFESVVGEHSVDDLLGQTEVSKDAIESFGEKICVCQLAEPDAPDLEPLRDVYLERGAVGESANSGEINGARGRSLELILYLAHLASEYDVQFTRSSLFDMCYYNEISNGNNVIAIELPDVWHPYGAYWQVLRAHDFLTYTARALLTAWLAYLQRVGGGTGEGFIRELQSEEVMDKMAELTGINGFNQETRLSTVVDNLWPHASSSAIVDTQSVNGVSINHSLSEYTLNKRLRSVCSKIETSPNDKRFITTENVNWTSLYVYWLPLLIGVCLRLSNLPANSSKAWDWVREKGERNDMGDDPTPYALWMSTKQSLQKDMSVGRFIGDFFEDYLLIRSQHLWEDRGYDLSEYWFIPADGSLLLGMSDQGFICQKTYLPTETSSRFSNTKKILRDLGLLRPDSGESMLTPDGRRIIEPLIGCETT